MLFRSIPEPSGYEIRYKGEVRKPVIQLSGLQLIVGNPYFVKIVTYGVVFVLFNNIFGSSPR